MAEATKRVKTLWEAQARRLALWAPALIGLGVWIWFATPAFAVPLWATALAGGAALAAGMDARRRGAIFATLLCVGTALAVLGYGAATLRQQAVDAPVLAAPHAGAAEGRAIALDRARSGAPRVLLDRVRLAGVAPQATPAQVRITLSGVADGPALGARIRVTSARLAPPPGPAAPGAFDFSQRAYFARLGAIGYARGGFETLAPPEPDPPPWLRLQRLRAQIAEGLRAAIPGREGAIAAALAVGDRSGIPPEALQALRDSGLAHLLAISGLHIGLMGALAFWIVRLALAAVPGLAERFAIRKAAALAALAAAAAYLALSGASVATQRAFVMAAVAFGAILIDRPAITARGLALAACVVLLMRPESLYDAGFQMSFAAAAALVAGYEATRGFWRRRALRRGAAARLWTAVLGTAATSLLAGLATAPFAAFHFNRVAAFGLLANLAAVPAMGLWIMPALIAVAALAPLGLWALAAPALGAGIGYVLWVAEGVAGLEGAARGVGAGPPFALALIVWGGLWLLIWRGGLRLAGAPAIAAGLVLWGRAPAPDLLIAPGADLIAGRLESGELWISRPRAEPYAAALWLRRDGEARATQLEAHDRAPWRCDRRRCVGRSAGRAVVLVRSGAPRAADCVEGGVLLSLEREPAPGADCLALGPQALRAPHAFAVRMRPDGGLRVETAAPSRGGRSARGHAFIK